MNDEIIKGVIIPFIGTSLGSACVFFLKDEMSRTLQRSLSGFAAGVMVAASVWSLLIPAAESSAEMGKYAFLPAVIGLWAGIFFLLLVDSLTPHLHIDCSAGNPLCGGEREGIKCSLSRTTLLVLAVAIHNIPEGMAVGVSYAAWESGSVGISSATAFALALGIAIQNAPEGAIISMPLRAEGMSRTRACMWGIATGAAEPLAALMTIYLAEMVAPALPYMLGFAAGAMLYVVVEELIPEMAGDTHTNIGTLMFGAGFSLMMALDTMLG